MRSTQHFIEAARKTKEVHQLKVELEKARAGSIGEEERRTFSVIRAGSDSETDRIKISTAAPCKMIQDQTTLRSVIKAFPTTKEDLMRIKASAVELQDIFKDNFGGDIMTRERTAVEVAKVNSQVNLLNASVKTLITSRMEPTVERARREAFAMYTCEIMEVRVRAVPECTPSSALIYIILMPFARCTHRKTTYRVMPSTASI
jgi:hypothetical protein